MLGEYFEWIKALHASFVIFWMSGMLYLPRLFVYHTEVTQGTPEDERFKTMERRLLRIIINPAMIIAVTTGLMMVHVFGKAIMEPWFYIKVSAVLVMVTLHGFLAKWRKDFERGKNKHSRKFYAIINEVPAVLILIIVFMVILKPFE